VDLLARFADKKAEGTEHDRGSAPHLQVKSGTFRAGEQMAQELLPEPLTGTPEK
jgi:hypothetical protein